MRTIIATAGTSVVRGLKRQEMEPDNGDRLLQQLTQGKIREWGDTASRLSAELSTLNALEADSNDRLVLIATDTDFGEQAADLVARIARIYFGTQAEVVRIEGLVLDDADVFRKTGLVQLVETLDRTVRETRGQGREPVLGIGGGIKSVTPYAAVYGMMRQVPLAYMFEFTNRLLTMPRLPLRFDWEAIRATRNVLAQIRDEDLMEYHQMKNQLGGYYRTVEGLFEKQDNLVTLSTFGQMLLRDVEAADETTVFLSSRARKTLEASDGSPRQQLEFILHRLPNRLWRDQKFKAISRTDLDVWKPGTTAERAAGWVKPYGVYVAELYTDWNYYTDDIKEHQREDYNENDFTPWTPDEEIDPLTDEEKAADRLRTRNETLAKERDRARQRAAKYKSSLEDTEGQLRTAEEENAALRSELKEAKRAQKDRQP